MLPAHWRLVAVNDVGEQIDTGEITIDYRTYKGDGSGGVSYGAEQTASNSGNIADGGEEDITGTVNNTSDAAVGIVGNVAVDLSTGTAPDGDVEVYVEGSTDGGTEWNRAPSPLAIVPFTGTAEANDRLFST